MAPPPNPVRIHLPGQVIEITITIEKNGNLKTILIFWTGLFDLLDASNVPHSVALQEFPQAPPHVQATHRFQRHCHSPL